MLCSRLADAHYSFLQMALDPRLPSSLHSLPQKYNIPVRLWQIGFHQPLERMRHAVTTSTGTDVMPVTNVLEHLIEFIQYAYTHYSQLFEDPSVAVFRSAWIEQLGDLARYRMAVAGLASRVSAAEARSHAGASKQPLPRLDDLPERREARPLDGASIGDAALGDWELEEQETWRVMARDWYGQGITETPGSGRLQHHLALLSKGDELRGLYHFVKRWVTFGPLLRIARYLALIRFLCYQFMRDAPVSWRQRVHLATFRRRDASATHSVGRLFSPALCPPPWHALHPHLP